jgi:putative protease
MELVTAANNEQVFIAATESPVDGIYLPLTGLVAIRWGRDFFDLAQLPALIDLAHKASKKVYPVINGHPDQTQLTVYRQAARRIYEAGADGVVVGGPEIIHWIKQELSPQPPFVIIASSSGHAVCRQDIDFLYQLGADRVIISRLHGLTEVKELARRCAPQLELFVHGLLCPCWEGRDCLLPLYTYGDEADRGCCLAAGGNGLSVACTEYRAADRRPMWAMRVQSDLLRLPQIVSCGVDSIKVIPPADSISTWKRVIGIWRRALDEALTNEEPTAVSLKEELISLSPLPVEFDLREA